MSDDAKLRIEQARRAKEAYVEFVQPALERIDATYAERVKEIVAREPWEIEKIKALVMAQRVLDMVAGQLKAAIVDGEVAKADLIKIENITSMTHARRRALGL